VAGAARSGERPGSSDATRGGDVTCSLARANPGCRDVTRSTTARDGSRKRVLVLYVCGYKL
jgi:hypothetical protein